MKSMHVALLVIAIVIIVIVIYALLLNLYLKGLPITLSEKRYEVEKRVLKVDWDGHQIYGELLIPKREGKIPLVICSHGFGVNGNCTEILAGRSLSRSGIACYCFSFYGGSNRSKSKGKMLEMTPLAEVDQLLTIFKAVKDLSFVDKDEIYLFGESQGALVSALASLKIQGEIKKLILYYPAFSIPSMAKDLYNKGLKDTYTIFHKKISSKYILDAKDIDIYGDIKSFEKPVLIVHGNSDKVVDVSYGKRASETYKDCKYVELNRQGHGFNGMGKRKAIRYVYDFIGEK